MDETRELTIDLRKMLYMMKGKFIYVLLVTVLFGAVAGCFTHFFIDDIYSARVKMYVYSNTDRQSSEFTISSSEINASKDLIGTYMEILESNTVLEKVIADLGLNASTEELNKMITPSAVEGTQLFMVTVRSTDPYLAARIANSIAKVAPDEIVRIVKAGGVEIVDKANTPKRPSSPNIKRNIVVGAFLVFILSFCALFIYELFDSTITNAKDLERDFDIPILGTIPRLEAADDDDTASSDGFSISKVMSKNKTAKGDAKND